MWGILFLSWSQPKRQKPWSTMQHLRQVVKFVFDSNSCMVHEKEKQKEWEEEELEILEWEYIYRYYACQLRELTRELIHGSRSVGKLSAPYTVSLPN